jgi:hypothetical protein
MAGLAHIARHAEDASQQNKRNFKTRWVTWLKMAWQITLATT